MNIIQTSWQTDDDGLAVLNYFKNNKIAFQILTKDSILKLKPRKIKSIFADTDVIQTLLSEYLKIKKTIPTYPKCFESLYKREIKALPWKDCSKLKLPYFVKPYTNDKLFEAVVIKNKWDYMYVDDHLQTNTLVYYSPVVKFLNEFRVFIGNNKIYAVVESTKFVLNNNDISKEVSSKPPKEFLNQILTQNNLGYCVVDIALKEVAQNKPEWCVVEVNPPYAISGYGLEIETYIQYNQDTWEYLLKYR